MQKNNTMKKILTFLISAIILSGCCNNKKLTILHTNDTHSHIEPEKNGNGGILNRALLIEHIADSVGRDNMLLLDCGDFSQGSLYYNVYKGGLEIEAMNAMNYDAATIGNHEFDFGLENLAQLIKKAEFPFVCSNYDFSGTPCEGLVKPYIIIERAEMKIGLFGLSPELDGLVLKDNYNGVKFRSPTDAAKECVNTLQNAGCELIICLSHLGWQIPNKYNDEQLAAETSGIDIILGGHSHDQFEKPLKYENSTAGSVIMNQTGKYGRNIGVLSVKIGQ